MIVVLMQQHGDPVQIVYRGLMLFRLMTIGVVNKSTISNPVIIIAEVCLFYDFFFFFLSYADNYTPIRDFGFP